MSLYHRFRRRFLSRILLARVFFSLLGLLIVLVTAIFVLPKVLSAISTSAAYLTYSIPQEAGITSAAIWLSADPPQVYQLVLSRPPTSLKLIHLPNDTRVPTLKTTLGTVYSQGEARQPGSGGLTLVQSSVAEITHTSMTYVLSLTPDQAHQLTLLVNLDRPKSPLIRLSSLLSPGWLSRAFHLLYVDITSNLPSTSFIRILQLGRSLTPAQLTL